LEHYRNEDSKKSLNIEDKLQINTLNIIRREKVALDYVKVEGREDE